MIMGLVSRTPLAVQANNYRRPRKVCLERLLQNVLKTTEKRAQRPITSDPLEDRALPSNTSPSKLTPQLRALLSLHNETLTCKPSGVTRRDVTLFLILLPYGIDLHFFSLSLSLFVSFSLLFHSLCRPWDLALIISNMFLFVVFIAS